MGVKWGAQLINISDGELRAQGRIHFYDALEWGEWGLCLQSMEQESSGAGAAFSDPHSRHHPTTAGPLAVLAACQKPGRPCELWAVQTPKSVPDNRTPAFIEQDS